MGPYTHFQARNAQRDLTATNNQEAHRPYNNNTLPSSPLYSDSPQTITLLEGCTRWECKAFRARLLPHVNNSHSLGVLQHTSAFSSRLQWQPLAPVLSCAVTALEFVCVSSQIQAPAAFSHSPFLIWADYSSPSSSCRGAFSLERHHLACFFWPVTAGRTHGPTLKVTFRTVLSLSGWKSIWSTAYFPLSLATS